MIRACMAAALLLGAAALLLMSREKADELKLKPLAKIHGFKVVGLEPEYMGMGPSKAIPALMEKMGKKLGIRFDVVYSRAMFAESTISGSSGNLGVELDGQVMYVSADGFHAGLKYGVMFPLGGPLFTDGVSRLYVLSMNAELFAVDSITYAVSGILGSGPAVTTGLPGWTGLAGPLTDCVSGFPE